MVRFIAMLFLMFANSAFAQVQAPDYKDESRWMFEGGDLEFLQPTDQNFVVWHDHYSAVMSDEPTYLVIFYKPVQADLLVQEGEDKFAVVSREKPWFMVYIIENALNDTTFHLFEYENNSFKYLKTFDEELQLEKFVFENYDLR